MAEDLQGAERRRRRARAALVGRLAVGHFASYPIAFACALGGMSLAIIARSDAIEAVQGLVTPQTDVQRWLVDRLGIAASEAASFALIMEPIVWLASVLFVVSHLAAIPWARAARRAVLDPGAERELRVAARRYALVVGLPTALVLLAGVVGWAVILTR